MALVQKELKNAYIGEYVPPYLCFTANEANSTVQINKTWNPTSVTLETSTDWATWTSYTIWDTITLTNIGDKVYWRNTSETPTWFTTSSSDYYQFNITWLVWASGDIDFLLCKNGTDTLVWSYCFYRLFRHARYLTTPPSLPATTLTASCYRGMFAGCTRLVWIPSLPATTLPDACYFQMFSNSSGIKLSATQTWDYQTAYRIPTTWTWSVGTDSIYLMFDSTGGTVTSAVTINTTYYTSNTVV